MHRSSLCALVILGFTGGCFSPSSATGETDGSSSDDGSTSTTSTGSTTMQPPPTMTAPPPTMTSPSTDPTLTTTTDTTDTSTTDPTDTTTTDPTDTTTTDPTDTTTTTDPTDTSSSTGDESSSTGEPLVCDAPEVVCDDACADLNTDTSNCGECGHDCLGGTCDAGECQPVQLATGFGRLFMIVVTDEHVFVGGDGVAIRRLDKDGGDPVQIAPAGDYAYDYAYTGDAIVWNNDWNSAQWSVRGCAAPGCAGGVQQYQSGTSGVFGMAFNDNASTLYYNQGATIQQIVWPGGNPTTFVTGIQALRGMTSHEDFVYWIDRQAADDVDIRKRAPGGASSTTMAFGRPDTGNWLAANATRLFWSEGSNIVSAVLPNGIGGNDPDEVGSVGGSVREIVADDEYVYWAADAGGAAGSIARCPTDGCTGAPTLLADPVDEPWGMALDETAVYWVTENGVVSKVAK